MKKEVGIRTVRRMGTQYLALCMYDKPKCKGRRSGGRGRDTDWEKDSEPGLFALCICVLYMKCIKGRRLSNLVNSLHRVISPERDLPERFSAVAVTSIN